MTFITLRWTNLFIPDYCLFLQKSDINNGLVIPKPVLLLTSLDFMHHWQLPWWNSTSVWNASQHHVRVFQTLLPQCHAKAFVESLSDQPYLHSNKAISFEIYINTMKISDLLNNANHINESLIADTYVFIKYFLLHCIQNLQLFYLDQLSI